MPFDLFGSIDRLCGQMNLFAWMNLEDYQAGIELRPLEDVQKRTRESRQVGKSGGGFLSGDECPDFLKDRSCGFQTGLGVFIEEGFARRDLG